MFRKCYAGRKCSECGKDYIVSSPTQRACDTCRAERKRRRDRERSKGANDDALTRAEYLAACRQMRDAREAARLMREHLAQLEAQLRFTAAEEAAPDLASLFGSTPASH